MFDHNRELFIVSSGFGVFGWGAGEVVCFLFLVLRVFKGSCVQQSLFEINKHHSF